METRRLKSIEITLRDDLAGRAEILGRHAMSRLQELTKRHGVVKAIRGRGLLLGVELTPPFAGPAFAENFTLMVASGLLNDHGVLTSYFDLAPRVLRFEPPLIVSEEEINYAVDAFDQVLGRGVGGLTLSAGKNMMTRLLDRTG